MELILTLREARNLKRTQLLGAQDPYCNVSIPNIFDATTEVHHHGGSNPWWNASFLVSVPETIPSGLTLAVHIKNAMHVLPDRSIGKARVDLDALATAFATDDIYHEWVPVLHNGVHVGDISIALELAGIDDVRGNVISLTSPPVVAIAT